MYFYRCTEQQLGDALERITEAGDTLLFPVYKGGRDWVLICRKASKSPAWEITGLGSIHRYDSTTGKVVTYNADAPEAAAGGGQA